MQQRRPPEQLDIPLVWEQPSQEGVRERPKLRPTEEQPLEFRSWQLWLATLVDLGFMLACLFVSLLTVTISGGWFSSITLVFAWGLALELAFFVALASLWAWRGTPGMLLMGLAFDHPLPLPLAIKMILWWAGCLLLAGIPMIIKSSGRTLAERLAETTISPRSSHGDA